MCCVEARLELQDIIRLPECGWPLHAAYGMAEGAYLFSVSLSVRRGQPHETRARDFLREVSRRAFEALGVKVLLLKPSHCDAALLRRMHAPFVEALGTLKLATRDARRPAGCSPPSGWSSWSLSSSPLTDATGR